LEIAADAAIWGAFCNAGQSCSSVERLYVEKSIADKFTQLLVDRAKHSAPAKPTSPDLELGPRRDTGIYPAAQQGPCDKVWLEARGVAVEYGGSHDHQA